MKILLFILMPLIAIPQGGVLQGFGEPYVLQGDGGSNDEPFFIQGHGGTPTALSLTCYCHTGSSVRVGMNGPVITTVSNYETDIDTRVLQKAFPNRNPYPLLCNHEFHLKAECRRKKPVRYFPIETLPYPFSGDVLIRYI